MGQVVLISTPVWEGISIFKSDTIMNKIISKADLSFNNYICAYIKAYMDTKIALSTYAET